MDAWGRRGCELSLPSDTRFLDFPPMPNQFSIHSVAELLLDLSGRDKALYCSLAGQPSSFYRTNMPSNVFTTSGKRRTRGALQKSFNSNASLKNERILVITNNFCCMQKNSSVSTLLMPFYSVWARVAQMEDVLGVARTRHQVPGPDLPPRPAKPFTPPGWVIQYQTCLGRILR